MEILCKADWQPPLEAVGQAAVPVAAVQVVEVPVAAVQVAAVQVAAHSYLMQIYPIIATQVTT